MKKPKFKVRDRVEVVASLGSEKGVVKAVVKAPELWHYIVQFKTGWCFFRARQLRKVE